MCARCPQLLFEGRKVPTRSPFEQEASKIGTQKCSTKRDVREPLKVELALSCRQLMKTEVFEKTLGCNFLLTVGSFLLTAELFYLQLPISASLLAIGAFFAYSFSFFTYNWSFFAYNGKVHLIMGKRDCKQRSLTVSKESSSTVSNQTSSFEIRVFEQTTPLKWIKWRGRFPWTTNFWLVLCGLLIGAPLLIWLSGLRKTWPPTE